MAQARIETSAGGPIASAGMIWRLGQSFRIGLVVAVELKLVHGGAATVLPGARIVVEDRHRGEGTGSALDAARDLAPRKARADVTVTGYAHAPGSRAAASSVRLGVMGDRILIDKTLHVFGDRTRAEPTAQPFARMPLVYERAAQGPDNPAGVPATAFTQPNLFHPAGSASASCFAPISPTWPALRALLSADDARALASYPPILREDFPWRFFQSAPPDQQIDFLRGDERIVLDGMHPVLPRVETRLPQIRALAHLYQRSGAAYVDSGPVALVADTLAIDADRQTAHLVFRGDLPLPERAGALPLFHIACGIELAGQVLGGPLRPPPALRAVAAQTGAVTPEMMAQAREALPFAPGSAASGAAKSVQPAASATAAVKSMTGAKPGAAKAFGATTAITPEMLDAMRAGPATPFAAKQAVPAPKQASLAGTRPLSSEDLAALDSARATPWGNPSAESAPAGRPANDGLAVLPFTRSAPGSAMPPPASSSPPPPAVLPPHSMVAPPASAPPPLLALLSMAPASAPPPADTPPRAPVATPPASVPPAEAAPTSMTPADPAPRAAAPATGVRAEVMRRLAEGQGLSGLDLVKADLTELDLSDCVLTGADLRGARFAGAKLLRARLSDAKLSGADLSGVNLEEAQLARADLSRATLARASLRGADLTDAILSDVRGAEAIFDGARLARARLDGAMLAKASLRNIDAPELAGDRAVLSEANLEGAQLKGASLVGASCERATLAHADLTGARLSRLLADGADCSSALLEGADLRQAQMRGARFDGARLARIQAVRADLSEASFVAADLTEAILRPVKLLRADLSRAVLDGADLRDADLTGATLTGASRKGTKLNGARVKDLLD